MSTRIESGGGKSGLRGWRESFADSFTQTVADHWYRFAPFRIDSRVWWDQPKDAYMAGLRMQVEANINLAKETFPG